MAKITINGKEYKEKDLNDKAKAHVSALRVVNNEINSLEQKIALTKTARNMYGVSLTPNLPEKEAASNRKKDVVTINGKRYAYSDMSEKAIADAMSIGAVDQRLAQLNSELAIAKTAKSAYTKALQENI